MVKVRYEHDETALISYTCKTKSLVYENADRQQHITCKKVKHVKMTLRDIEQLQSWPYIFIHPEKTPADCDYKYIRGIHLHDVITETAMETEAHSQL